MNYTDKQKRMFYTSGYHNNYMLNFPDLNLRIDNDTIHTESPMMKESICEDEDLTLGGCIASSFEFEVSEIIQHDLTGLEFEVKLETNAEDGSKQLITPMGRYRVDTAVMEDDKDYKKVTAYDALYDASEDVSDWYNDFFANTTTHTIKETREGILDHFGIPYVEQSLINDNIVIEKTIEPNGDMPGNTLLKSLCVINGGFGRMNRYGQFEVIYLRGAGLFPEDSQSEDLNLYPEDTAGEECIYPEDDFEYLGISNEEISYPEWRSVKAEDFITNEITCLSIKTDDEDVGVTVGDDVSNPYIITANIFLYGKSQAELEVIAWNILNQIKGISYRPNTTELNGLPYMEVGDAYALVKNKGIVEAYILARTIKGIDALIDTFEAKGNKIRTNEVTEKSEIQQLKGKTLKIQKNIDKFSLSLSDIEEKTESLLEMTASTIVLQVQKDGKVAAMALDASGDEVNFTLSADNVKFEGNKIDLTSKELSIESDNFEVSPEGNVIAKSIEIKGGSIDLETDYTGENTIHLQNVNCDATVEIDHFGEGEPEEIGEIYDTYLDLTTGIIWRVETRLGGKYWNEYARATVESIQWSEININSNDGYSVSNYNWFPTTNGNGDQELYKEGTELFCKSDAVEFNKTIYTTSMGVPKINEINASCYVDIYDYDDDNNPLPKVVFDTPVESEMFIGDLKGNADTAEQAEKDGNGNIIADTYLPLTGGTLSDNLYIQKNADNEPKVNVSDGDYSVSLMVSKSNNSGVYDHKNSKWIVRSDGEGNVRLNGTAKLAESMDYKTYVAASTSETVGGEPVNIALDGYYSPLFKVGEVTGYVNGKKTGYNTELVIGGEYEGTYGSGGIKLYDSQGNSATLTADLITKLQNL